MNEVLHALSSQHTTRREQFSDKCMEPEALESIKNAILKTANASNRQSYSVIVLDAAHAKSLRLPGDRVFLFCVDFFRLHQCAKKLRIPFDSQYLMQFVTALTDISMLAQSAILAAQSIGIDTLLTNEIYHQRLNTVFEQLNIPEKQVFPMLALCMGYAKAQKADAKGRISPDYIFHENTYQPLSDEQVDRLIGEYDDGEENLALIKDWAARESQHYLEWFFTKWSPAIGSRKQSDFLLESLKKHEMIE